MRILIPVLIVIIVVVTHLVVDRITQNAANRDLKEVDAWPELSIEDRLLAHTKFTCEFVQNEAARRRNAITFAVSVTLGGAFLIGGMDQITAKTRDEATENCRNFRTLVNILATDLDNEIRHTTSERDELSDAIKSEEIEDIPGYENLTEVDQAFFQGLLDNQIIEAEAEVRALDIDIIELRNREDILSGFAGTLDCP